jgi:hypothetical protein
MEAALLAQSGLDVPAIAAEMGLSQRGVRRHLQAARAQGVATAPVQREAPAPKPAQSKRDGRFSAPRPKPARARVYMGDGQGHEIRYAGRERGALGPDLQPGDLEMIDGKPTGRYLIGTATVQAANQHALDYFSPSETEARARAVEAGAVRAYHVVDGVLTEVEELV